MNRHFFLMMAVLFTGYASWAQNSKTAAEFYNEGLQLKASEKYREAAAAFKQAVEKRPGYKEALYEYGWCLNEVQDYPSAIMYLQMAAGLGKPEKKLHFELGYAFEKNKDLPNARTNFKKVLIIDPGYYSAYMHLGDIFYEEELYDSALNNYIHYFDNDKVNNSYYYKAGWCANDIGRYEEAINYLEKFEATDTANQAKKLQELGYAHFKLQHNDDAIAAYTKVLEMDPRRLPAIKGLGNVYYENTKEYKEAIRYFERAMQQDEANSKAYYYKLGWLYNDVEQYAAAARMLEKAIVYKDRDASYREELGYTYLMQANYNEAVVQLKKAIEINPQSKMGYYYQGLCYLAQNKKNEAMSIYQRLKVIDAPQAEKLLARINEK